jgi:hypothetical protein
MFVYGSSLSPREAYAAPFADQIQQFKDIHIQPGAFIFPLSC